MTPEPRPAAEPFDPGSGELPPALERVFTHPESPILLLVAAEADEAAARVAIGLAAARARHGHSTVLADAGLDAPRLHEELDVPNLEGLVDVFLFGASLRRVAVRPDDRAFDFVPAGAYAPDPAEVLQSPRWQRIAEELSGEDALLLVFVPAAAPGARALSRRVGRAVVLGDDRAAERAALRLDPQCRIVAAVEPPSAVGARRRSAAEGGAPEGAPAEEGAPSPFRAPDLTEPVVIRLEKEERRTSPVLLFAFIVALAAGGWYGYQELFGGSVPGTGASAAVTAGAGAGEEGRPAERPIPYSIALEAYQDLPTAMDRVRLLERAVPDLDFHLAPVSVRGDLFYRLLAGPMEDGDAAAAVMQRLVDEGHKSAVDEWAMRPRPLAFHLGDYDTRDGADARVEALAVEGIPAYVVARRVEGGQSEYRVYGGAYETRAEAEVMREMLENAGESARLVERVGEPVA